jgi:copper homeostasis protein
MNQVNDIKKQLEVIAFTTQACIQAQALGVHRVELCQSPLEGGTTPSFGFIKKAREIFTGELYPMLRPRGGSFLYTKNEFEQILVDADLCKQLGCDGVVFGALNIDAEIEVEMLKQLIQKVYPLEVTFHRAFDRVKDPFKALEQLINAGCNRILTSGLQPTALEGASVIKQLIEKANNQIIIMPGVGIRGSNIKEIMVATNATQYHSAARLDVATTLSYNNPNLAENLQHTILNEDDVRLMLNILTN